MKGIAYRVLCGGLGLGLMLFGLGFVLAYFAAIGPGAGETIPGVPMGPPALYFMAFSGCALVGWGGGLLGVLRDPGSPASRAIGTGDSPFPGNLPRIEAGLMLLLALAFLWLRPERAGRTKGGR